MLGRSWACEDLAELTSGKPGPVSVGAAEVDHSLYLVQREIITPGPERGLNIPPLFAVLLVEKEEVLPKLHNLGVEGDSSSVSASVIMWLNSVKSITPEPSSSTL